MHFQHFDLFWVCSNHTQWKRSFYDSTQYSRTQIKLCRWQVNRHVKSKQQNNSQSSNDSFLSWLLFYCHHKNTMTKSSYKRKHLIWGLTVPEGSLWWKHGSRQAGKHGTGAVDERLSFIYKHKRVREGRRERRTVRKWEQERGRGERKSSNWEWHRFWNLKAHPQ